MIDTNNITIRSISLFDLAIHSPRSAEEAENMNVQKLWYDIRGRIEGFDFTEVRDIGSELVAFNHLLGGYDMAYYSYLWYVARIPSDCMLTNGCKSAVPHLRRTYSRAFLRQTLQTLMPGGVIARPSCSPGRNIPTC